MEELLRRNRPVVYRAAYRLTGDAQDAEDVVQETMLRAIENVGRFRGEARFSSWLVAIAVNAALSVKRKEKRVRWVSLDEPLNANAGTLLVESLRDRRLNPEQEYRNKELRVLVRRAIARQHPKFQLILRSCELNGIPIEEVADTLKITRAAAKSRLFRARRMLSSTVRKQAGIGRLP